MVYNTIDNNFYFKEKTMKRIASLLIVLVLVATMIVACNEPTPSVPTEKDYTLAIGVVVAEDLAGSSVDETVATIVTDKDGKIVLCRVDCVAYEAAFDAEGALVTTAPTSKVTLGDNYKMPSGSWAKQTAALEKFVVGKTRAEVAAIALNGGKPTDAELSASCTFNITDLLKAIDNAFASEHKVSFKSAATTFTAGLNAAAAVEAPEGAPKSANLVVDYAATVLADGAVVAAILDCTDVTLNNIGENGAESVTFAGTKRVQGDAYEMTSGAWYKQADAFAKTAVGKTAADVEGLAVEGVAGCTMPYSPFTFKTGLVAAVKGAR